MTEPPPGTETARIAREKGEDRGEGQNYEIRDGYDARGNRVDGTTRKGPRGRGEND